MTEEFSNETDKIEKLINNSKDDSSNETELNKDIEDIKNKLNSGSRKINQILSQYKLVHFPIRVHKDLSKHLDAIHSTLIKNGYKGNDKYKSIEKSKMFSLIISHAKELNNPYIKWVREYKQLTSKILKYNYEDVSPTIELMRGGHYSTTYEMYEDDIKILKNLAYDLHVYKLSIGDTLLILLAKFIESEECLSDYRELSSHILSSWNKYEMDLPTTFYMTNMKIANDILDYKVVSSLNILLPYIDFVIDVTNEEKYKSQNVQYIYFMYSKFVNDLYEKLKISIMEIDEKKEFINNVIYKGKFNVKFVSYLRNKINR